MGDRLYLGVCAATAAYRVPGLIAALQQLRLDLLTLLTPNATQVLSPRELVRVPGHRLALSYFDSGLLPRPEPGAVLLAPCTFNSLNKLANGTPDNLPLSLATEAIGRGWPVLLAPSLNFGLWHHPRRAVALAQLQSWGVKVLVPRVEDEYAMVPDEQIVAAVREALSSSRHT